jgi:transcription termination factor NusB
VSREPVESVIESSSELQSAGEAAREFASRLVEGTVDRPRRSTRSSSRPPEHWRLGACRPSTATLLRLAVYELLEESTSGGRDQRSAEVAKRFSSPESAGFVNGVLDAVNQELNAKAQ